MEAIARRSEANARRLEVGVSRLEAVANSLEKRKCVHCRSTNGLSQRDQKSKRERKEEERRKDNDGHPVHASAHGLSVMHSR